MPPQGIFHKTNHPTTIFGYDEWLVAWSLGRLTTHAFDDLGKSITSVGKAVEVVLALAAAVYDSAVPQQSQVVAESRLAHVKLVAQPTDMALTFGEQGDDLKSGWVADLLEQNGCPLNGLCPQLSLVLGSGNLPGFLHAKD